MYEYIPPQNHKKALHIIFSLAVGGTVLFALGALLDRVPFHGLWQFCGIAAWTFAVFIYTRYVTKGYVYGVERGENEACDFLVTELARKSRLTVCRLSLDSIEDVIILRKADKRNKKRLFERLRGEGRKIFDYSAEIFPSVKYFVLAEEGGEKFAVAIVADDTLLRLLMPLGRNTENADHTEKGSDWT